MNLSKTLDNFPIFGDCIFGMRRRHLACLDAYLHGRSVWVFEAQDEGSDIQTNPLCLEKCATHKPDEVITFSAGLGHIVPWPI